MAKDKNSCRSLGRKPEGRRKYYKTRHKWKDNIKMI
jgi:hypothetical protein